MDNNKINKSTSLFDELPSFMKNCKDDHLLNEFKELADKLQNCIQTVTAKKLSVFKGQREPNRIEKNTGVAIMCLLCGLDNSIALSNDKS
jgi:hypothetical protein